MEIFQTCDVVDKEEKSYFHTNSGRRDANSFTKSLYDANGRHGDVGVSATKSFITKCAFKNDAGFPAATFFDVVKYSKKALVRDIDVISFKKDWYGIVVAVNEHGSEPDEDDSEMLTKAEKTARDRERPHDSVLLFMPGRNDEFLLKRCIRVYGEITCMRVLISPLDMPSQQHSLSPKIASWPNIVAIGCKKSACFLGQFEEFDLENAEHWANEVPLTTTATTDALKALITKDRFEYRMGGNKRTFNKNTEHVTAVSYIPCYAVAIVGMSNGCIVLVPLDNKSCMHCLCVQYQTPIRFLTVLEPEYDPQGGFYIFSARERPSGNAANTALVIFSHKIARVPNDDGGYEYQDMNSVMIPMRDGDRWITVHGVVKKRRQQRKDHEATMDTTGDSRLPEGLNTTQHQFSDGMERTLLFFTYVTLDGQMKGGLFDLNAFYSRRCNVQQVRFDQFGQDPICSTFTLDMPKRNTGAQLFRVEDISSVTCHRVDAYDSAIFDREPLFQPMAARLRLQIHLTADCAYAAKVDPLQWRVIERIGRELTQTLAQPDAALQWLERVGLELAPTTRKERLRMDERPANERVPTELDKILRAIAGEEGTRQDLIRLINASTDRKQQLHIGRWLFNELREIVVRMNETVAPLFEAVPYDQLSNGAREMIHYFVPFFEYAEKVFWTLRARGIELFNDTTRLRYTRKLHALMASALRFYINTVMFLTIDLPLNEPWVVDLLEEVAELAQQRAEKARREDHPLFLDALLARLHEKTMEDELWRGLPNPAQWYPPTYFNLCSLLRQTEADTADRVALAFYYLMDVDECLARDRKKPKADRRYGTDRKYAIKDLARSYYNRVAKELTDEQAEKGVRERWEADMAGRPANEQENGAAKGPPSVFNDEEKAEFNLLMKQFARNRRLQPVDEARMRELFAKQTWSDFRWNLCLIKKGRWPEVADLPLPPEPYQHEVVAQYAKYKQMALAQKAQLPPYTGRCPAPCPVTYTKVAPPPKPASPPKLVKTAHITFRNDKTPKKINIFKRLNAPAAAADQTGNTTGLATPPPAPSADVARINALMKTPTMRFHNAVDSDEDEDEDAARRKNGSDLAPDEVARVRDALRTPRSRANLVGRSGAAATGAGEGTPEGPPRAMVAPTSILKSAHKDSRLPSATKSRLRFANVFEEKTISPRDRTADTVSTTASMSQPNFDDSFDDDGDRAAKLTASHDTTSGLSTTTRLEREIIEEEQRRAEARNAGGEEEETEETSMPLSMVEEEEEVTEERMEEQQEEGEGEGEDEQEEEEEVDAAAAALAQGESFQIYHDSDRGRSTDDEAEVAFVEEEDAVNDDDDVFATAAGDVPPPAAAAKTPPPSDDTRKEEEEEEENVSRAATPVDMEEQEEEEEEHQPAAADSPQLLEGGGGSATAAASDILLEQSQQQQFQLRPEPADESTSSTPSTSSVVIGGGDDVSTASTSMTSPAAAYDATFTVVNATFTVAVGGAGEETGDDPAAADAGAVQPEEDNLSRAATPVEKGEEEVMEEGKPAAAAVADGEGEEQEEAVEEEQEMQEDEVEQFEAAVEEEEEEEEEAAAPAAPTVAPRGPPPVPKPRTVFPNRREPMALGLRSYIYMEEGVEKSYEEQSESSDDEEEGKKKKDKDDGSILARLGRRSSSRLLKGRVEGAGEKKEEVTVAVAAEGGSGSAARKRSRGRKESEKEAAGPSSSKRDRREKAEDEEDGEEQAEEGQHILTTERTRIVEERYVERPDGVLQHTVKQSTKVIETADGIVVKTDQDHAEMMEEEGDREEMLDEANRVTPAADAAAVEPTTERRSSRAAAAAAVAATASTSRTRTVSTASRASTRSTRSTKEEEEGEAKKGGEKEREEKATTPLRSPAKSVRRRKLMNDNEEEEEQKKQEEVEEPATPRRSSRARKPSESASSTVSQTPVKSARKSTARAATRTPSREPSAVPSSPARRATLVLKEAGDEEKKEKKQAAAAAVTTPSKRGRPRKEPVVVEDKEGEEDDDVAGPLIPRRKTTMRASTAASTRNRSASESLSKKRVEEEEEEPYVPLPDPMIELRKRKEATAASLAAKRLRKAIRLGLDEPEPATTKQLSTVRENSKEGDEEAEAAAMRDDQPSTSRAGNVTARSPARRKRTQSESVAVVKKEETLKTPAKKKAKEAEKDEDEGPLDQSMLRRSTRKAAGAANEGLKTPTRSTTRGKQ